jgi:hypothetical protein
MEDVDTSGTTDSIDDLVSRLVSTSMKDEELASLLTERMPGERVFVPQNLKDWRKRRKVPNRPPELRAVLRDILNKGARRWSDSTDHTILARAIERCGAAGIDCSGLGSGSAEGAARLLGWAANGQMVLERSYLLFELLDQSGAVSDEGFAAVVGLIEEYARTLALRAAWFRQDVDVHSQVRAWTGHPAHHRMAILRYVQAVQVGELGSHKGGAGMKDHVTWNDDGDLVAEEGFAPFDWLALDDQSVRGSGAEPRVFTNKEEPSANALDLLVALLEHFELHAAADHFREAGRIDVDSQEAEGHLEDLDSDLRLHMHESTFQFLRYSIADPCDELGTLLKIVPALWQVQVSAPPSSGRGQLTPRQLDRWLRVARDRRAEAAARREYRCMEEAVAFLLERLEPERAEELRQALSAGKPETEGENGRGKNRIELLKRFGSSVVGFERFVGALERIAEHAPKGIGS